MTPSAPARTTQLGLWDAVSIIIGIVVGAGIYETAPRVLANVGSPLAAFGVWFAGGLLSLVGAACYAELSSTYPRSGGDYVYLTRAFGPFAGFLFGWAQLAIILTGSIGMMAYVFADYAAAAFGLGATRATALAAGAVIVLTLVNVRGVATGKAAQNALTTLKVAGVAAVCLSGALLAIGAPEASAPSEPPGPGGGPRSVSLAMILVLYTFGGWNDAAFVASEVRDVRKNLPRALLLGTTAVTFIYLAMNAAFIGGLGFDGARASTAVGADLLEALLGRAGGLVMSLLVMVSALGAVNALILTGSRVHASVGADHGILAGLARWNPRLGVPARALVIQMVVTLALMALVGTAAGRALWNVALGHTGLPRVDWSERGGFDTLLRCSAPIFWLFFLLTGASLFVLRAKDPDRPRPFRVPLYPIVPALFCVTSAFMLHSALVYAGPLALIGALPLLAGAPAYLASKRRPSVLAPRSRSSLSGAE